MNSPDREADGVRATHSPGFEPGGSTADADHPGITGTATSSQPASHYVTPAADQPASVADVRKFLESVLAWPGVNNPGWVNLHVNRHNPDPKKNGGKSWVIGWPHKEPDDLIRRALWIDNSGTMQNVWMCMSTQSECATSTKSGKLKAVRKAANAASVKSIWIDVDVKADDPNHYANVSDARSAIEAFASKVGLPPPSAVVNSGGGLHVYWISDTPLTPENWRPYAEGLKALLLAHGVKCDAALTTDVARLLRVPCTLNHKYQPPRPVTLMELGRSYNFATSLSFLKTYVAAPSTTGTTSRHVEIDDCFNVAKPAAANAFLLSKGESLGAVEVKLVNPQPIFEQCRFLQEALLTGGKDYDQPLWHLSILSTVFMEGGNEIAHKISKGHPKYDHADTQAMFDRKVADHARGIGWPRCATIHGAGCKSCATCPFLAQGKSPLHLTRPVTAAANATAAAVAPAAWSAAAMRVSFSNIRHRRTLYGYDLVRGEITVLGSPGGVGKSSLAIGMAVSIAAGKELLDEKIRGDCLKVLLINAEDSTDEIRRRVWAFCLGHRVAEHELTRLYLAGADTPRVQALSFLRTNETGHSQLDQNGLAQLRAALKSLSPDVIVLDPLVALCANGNMNDNPSMSLVLRALKVLAAEFDCAILIVHHNRKNAEAGVADAISGAASIVNLARRAIMPVTLADNEAMKLGILPSERLRYFKLVDAKSNLAPRASDAPLYRLHSVELPNAEPPLYQLGDNVQAIVRVQLPIQNSATGSTGEDKIRQAILDLVERGKMIDGKSYPFSPSAAGADNARAILPDAIAAAQAATAPRQWSAGDLEAVVKSMIKQLLNEGTLQSCKMEDLVPDPGRFRRAQGVRVNPSVLTKGGSDAADTEAVS